MIVDGTNLSMIRGDTEFITVKPEDEAGVDIPLVFGDSIYFTVKLNTGTSIKVIQKVITVFDQGDAVIELLPSDTRNLECKAYKYDIQWITADNKIKTIITPSLFKIEPEITFESI